MTNIDRAAEIIERATRGARTTDGHPMKMSDHTAQIIAEALADDGALAPGPQIIRTRDELVALDPSTVVTNGPLVHAAVTAVPFHKIGMFTLPAVVIATGDHVRAARQALEDGA